MMAHGEIDIAPLARAIRRLLLRNFHPLISMHYWLGSTAELLRQLRCDSECMEWGRLPEGPPKHIETQHKLRQLLGNGMQLRRHNIEYRPGYDIYLEFTKELQEVLG